MPNRSDSGRDEASGRFTPGHKKLGGRRRWQPPRSLALSEAETVGELYDRLVRQYDSGKLDIGRARIALELVKLKATIVASEDTERRLAALEAKVQPDGEDD